MRRRRLLPRIVARLKSQFLGSIGSVHTDDSLVALTFDDGPHPDYTPRLLDLLDRYDARATFFMVGKAAEQYPQLVRQVAQAGHTIGNHSWDHASFPLLSGHERRSQIRRCARALAPYGERFFRPPYGHQNEASRLDALLLGHEVVTWSALAQDWLDHDVDYMAASVKQRLRPGAIVLMHDALHTMEQRRFGDREASFATVERLLVEFKDQYRFVSLTELLRSGRPNRQLWYREPDTDWIGGLVSSSE